MDGSGVRRKSLYFVQLRIAQRKEMQKLYRKALPYMERYRALEPKETEKWAAALYNIYLKLNMGREFEEIDRMLR